MIKFSIKCWLSVVAMSLLSSVRADDQPLKAPSIRSGVYEQVMLGITEDGRVTGYYNEQQGEAVVKECAFFFSGNLKGENAELKVWQDLEQGISSGELHKVGDDVQLKAPHAPDYSGCGLVLLPEIENSGVKLSPISLRPWLEIRQVDVRKTWLFSTPARSKNHKNYLLRDDVVAVLGYQDDLAQVDYWHEGSLLSGWVLTEDVVPIVPSK